MKYLFTITLLLGFIKFSFTQESTDLRLWFSGFVNSQIYMDSRQILESREGMVSLYPKAPSLDPNGNDINSRSSLNHLAMTSRLKVNLAGPDILGATVTGAIEGDFTGSSNIDNNGYRLREAYVKLNWTKRNLLIGSFWHPLYVFETSPFTIGLNTGAPFHPFSRHNQIRFEQLFKHSKLILFAGMQRDFSSSGYLGKTSEYQRNAATPNFHIQYQLRLKTHLLGMGIDYKSILPSLAGIQGLKILDDKYLNTLAFNVFSRFEFKNLSIKSQYILGSNLSEFIMLGGYILLPKNEANVYSYKAVKQESYWIDIVTKGNKIKLGLFAGYAKNKSGNVFEHEFYGLGNSIDYLYRISPRIQFHSNKFMWATEFEYTVASYFDQNQVNSSEIGNLRILTGLFYFF